MMDAAAVVAIDPVDGGQDVPDTGGQQELSRTKSPAVLRHDLERGRRRWPFAGGQFPGEVHLGVEELDDRSATIAKRVLGSSLVRLENEYDAIGGDTRYVTRLILGDDTVPGRLLLNKVARTKAFPEHQVAPWIRHHIEEIGNLENFLPDLVRYHADQEP